MYNKNEIAILESLISGFVTKKVNIGYFKGLLIIVVAEKCNSCPSRNLLR